MNIIVFDDDINFINEFKKSIQQLNENYNGLFTVSAYYNNVEDILAHVEDNKDNASFYILDIITDDVPVGFSIAKHIKAANEDNTVIYVTDYIEQILSDDMEHKMYALGFVHKEKKNYVSQIKVAYLQTYEIFKEKFLIINKNQKLTRIKYKDILYLQKEKGTAKLKVVYKDGYVTIKGNLNAWIKKLNNDFCYSAKDHIVNTKKIIEMNKIDKTLLLETGEVCPYARVHRKEIFDKCKLALR